MPANTSPMTLCCLAQAYNAAGGAFANAILRGTFGFNPPNPFGRSANDSAAALFAPQMGRGLNATLTRVRWRGALWSIASDAEHGLSMVREAKSRAQSYTPGYRRTRSYS